MIPITIIDLQLLSAKLYHLLNNLTPAEEAAIQRIIPLLSFVRLTHGNISSCGSVHCIWVQSKLGKVLPNLPEECKFIVVTRQGANGCRINSLKFEKKKIAEVLTLLKRTDHPAWRDIEINQDHLDR